MVGEGVVPTVQQALDLLSMDPEGPVPNFESCGATGSGSDGEGPGRAGGSGPGNESDPVSAGASSAAVSTPPTVAAAPSATQVAAIGTGDKEAAASAAQAAAIGTGDKEAAEPAESPRAALMQLQLQASHASSSNLLCSSSSSSFLLLVILLTQSTTTRIQPRRFVLLILIFHSWMCMCVCLCTGEAGGLAGAVPSGGRHHMEPARPRLHRPARKNGTSQQADSPSRPRRPAAGVHCRCPHSLPALAEYQY